MKLYELMLNLTTGIIGGIISSIIVSRIFLIHSEQEKQKEGLRLLQCKLSSLITTIAVYKDFIRKGEINRNSLSETQYLERMTNEYYEFINYCNFYFTYFDIMKADTETAIIVHDFQNEMYNKKNYLPLTYDSVYNLYDHLQELSNSVREYNKHSILHLNKKLLNDIPLRILAVILIIMITLTIIA